MTTIAQVFNSQYFSRGSLSSEQFLMDSEDLMVREFSVKTSMRNNLPVFKPGVARFCYTNNGPVAGSDR
jgi:hypothetical protein